MESGSETKHSMYNSTCIGPRTQQEEPIKDEFNNEENSQDTRSGRKQEKENKPSLLHYDERCSMMSAYCADDNDGRSKRNEAVSFIHKEEGLHDNQSQDATMEEVATEGGTSTSNTNIDHFKRSSQSSCLAPLATSAVLALDDGGDDDKVDHDALLLPPLVTTQNRVKQRKRSCSDNDYERAGRATTQSQESPNKRLRMKRSDDPQEDQEVREGRMRTMSLPPFSSVALPKYANNSVTRDHDASHSSSERDMQRHREETPLDNHQVAQEMAATRRPSDSRNMTTVTIENGASTTSQMPCSSSSLVSFHYWGGGANVSTVPVPPRPPQLSTSSDQSHVNKDCHRLVTSSYSHSSSSLPSMLQCSSAPQRISTTSDDSDHSASHYRSVNSKCHHNEHPPHCREQEPSHVNYHTGISRLHHICPPDHQQDPHSSKVNSMTRIQEPSSSTNEKCTSHELSTTIPPASSCYPFDDRGNSHVHHPPMMGPRRSVSSSIAVRDNMNKNDIFTSFRQHDEQQEHMNHPFSAELPLLYSHERPEPEASSYSYHNSMRERNESSQQQHYHYREHYNHSGYPHRNTHVHRTSQNPRLHYHHSHNKQNDHGGTNARFSEPYNNSTRPCYDHCSSTGRGPTGSMHSHPPHFSSAHRDDTNSHAFQSNFPSQHQQGRRFEEREDTNRHDIADADQMPSLHSHPSPMHHTASSYLTVPSSSSGGQLVPYYNRHILPLCTSDDENWLSEFLCFVRSQCVEVFKATREDVAARMNSKKVLRGQVGIRCRFCAHLPHRERTGRSSSFPSSINRIYQSLTMMLRDHFTKCTAMPPRLNERYLSLKANASQGATDSKRYWIDSAHILGLIDTGDAGIRFHSDRPRSPPNAPN